MNQNNVWSRDVLPGRAVVELQARLLPLQRTRTLLCLSSSKNISAGSTCSSLTLLPSGRKGTAAKSAAIYALTTGAPDNSVSSSIAFGRSCSSVPTPTSDRRGTAAKSAAIYAPTTWAPDISAHSVSSSIAFGRSASVPTSDRRGTAAKRAAIYALTTGALDISAPSVSSSIAFGRSSSVPAPASDCRGTTAKSAEIYALTTGAPSISACSVSNSIAFGRRSSVPTPTSDRKGIAAKNVAAAISTVTTGNISARSVSSAFLRTSSAPASTVTTQISCRRLSTVATQVSGTRFSPAKASLTRIKSLPSGRARDSMRGWTPLTSPVSSICDLRNPLSLLMSSQLKTSVDLLKSQIILLRERADAVIDGLQPICNSPTATTGLTMRNNYQILCPIRVTPASESVQFSGHERNDNNEDAGLLLPAPDWDSAKDSAKEQHTSPFQQGSSAILFPSPVCTRLVLRGVTDLNRLECNSPNFGSPKIRYLPGVGHRYVRTHNEHPMAMVDPFPICHSAEPTFTLSCGTVAQPFLVCPHITS